MVTRIKGNRIVTQSGIASGFIYIENGHIIDILEKKLDADEKYDFKDSYISAGFIDIHTHGGGGFDFADGGESVVRACNFHASHGVSSICPTVSAAPIEKMKESLCGIEEAMYGGRAIPNIIGAHLEGPYLSKKQCGAQSASHITEPKEDDYKKLITTHKKSIARWTYAPECDDGGRFCSFLCENGIVASAGHTDATYPDMLRAIKDGCTLVTHLFSCTSTVTRNGGFRIGGVIESTLLHDELYAEIIADGKHLPPELIKLVIKAKGADRIALVSDSLSVAGSTQTSGKMADTEYIIEDGVCKLANRSAFAGSIATADRLIRVMLNEVGTDLPTALKMMTEVPASIMRLNKGVLARGYDADITVFDENINIKALFVMGKRAF